MENTPDHRTIATMGGMKISIEEAFNGPLICIDFNNGGEQVHMKLPPETALEFGESVSEAARTALAERCEKHEEWEPYENTGEILPSGVRYETSDHGRMRRVSDHSIVRPYAFSSENVVYDFPGGGYLVLPVKRGCTCLAIMD